MYRGVSAVIAIILFMATYTYAIGYFHDAMNSQATYIDSLSGPYVAHLACTISVGKLRNNQQLINSLLNGNFNDKQLLESVRQDLSLMYGKKYALKLVIHVYKESLVYTDQGVIPEWEYINSYIISSSNVPMHFSSVSVFNYKNYQIVVEAWVR